MAELNATPTETELNIARSGITMQAEAHDLDTTDAKVRAFIEHQAQVNAQMFAQLRANEELMHRSLVAQSSKS
jgi:hypothetical protein